MKNLPGTPWMPTALLCPITVYIFSIMRAITLTPLFGLWIYFQIVNPLRFVTHIAHASMDRFFLLFFSGISQTHSYICNQW